MKVKIYFQKTENQLIPYRGKGIGYIFQDPMTSLNPTMSIGKQILEALKENKTKKKVYNLLEEVGISNPEERYSQYPHELSGGQRQRVMIAIAIAMNPKILIADETYNCIGCNNPSADSISNKKNSKRKTNKWS